VPAEAACDRHGCHDIRAVVPDASRVVLVAESPSDWDCPVGRYHGWLRRWPAMDPRSLHYSVEDMSYSLLPLPGLDSCGEKTIVEC
jgi:hypothetical protein